MRPAQVAVAYGVQGVNTSLATGTQTAAHAAAWAGEVAWAGAAAGLAAGMSSPVEGIKTVLDVRGGRRKARAARGRIDAASVRLASGRAAGDPAQTARDWLERRHGLESWVATRRCFQGSVLQLKRRRARWQLELARLQSESHLSRSAVARRDRLVQRLDALARLGPRRVAQLRSSAVSVEKRLKEGVSAGRNLGGLVGIASGLAAGSSTFMAFVATVCLPLLLPVLLLVDGVAGSVEATQLIRRARSGLAQLSAGLQRIRRSCAALQLEPVGSPGGLLKQGLEAIQIGGRGQERQWQRELAQGWVRRLRSAAFVVLAPVALGLGVATLATVVATPVGWALAALLGAVAIGYCIAQAVLNQQAARQARAVVARQRDYLQLTRRAGMTWTQRTALLARPGWTDNEYLAIELLVRAVVRAAQDTQGAWSTVDSVLHHQLRCGPQWRAHVFALAAAVPDDAPPDHPDIGCLSEALMRRFGLPVPKAGNRPGAA